MLQRMRTLAQQSANGSNNTSDRAALQQEYSQLTAEINRVASDTTFGGKSILNGDSKNNFSFQVGADAAQTISFNMGTHSFGVDGLGDQAAVKVVTKDPTTSVYTVGAAGATKIDWAADMAKISTASQAQMVLANIDSVINVVDSKRAELGAVQNRLDSTIRNQSNISENVSAARSRIRDADFATETANMTKQNILQQAASTVLAQANQRPQAALSLLQG